MQIPKEMQYVLKKIYGLPASITAITGKWKTGKTDFALLMAECLLQLGLVKKVATNIETDRFLQITGLNILKGWFFQESGRKLFLYDEVIESTPRRKPMSRLNVAWIQTIPQLSKAKGHLVAITQEQAFTESAFFNPTFCRGIWHKFANRESRVKNAVCHSPLISARHPEGYIINRIPKTKVHFNPFQLATFKLSESDLKFDLLPMSFKAVQLYAEGNSFDKIARSLGLNQATQVRRLIQRACRVFVTYLHEPSEGKRLVEMSKNIE